ncbi:hypothetical protein LIER_01423 [Lithospermum erythrorhizon]|uniref:Uncharacterized protein n=1 Tax=Lithospermum erythrorhizon TaxID=34254 RepID=A0AAV3NQN8_LITER
MLMGWLINSMEPEMNKKYMYFQTTKQIWDGTKKMYSDREDTSFKNPDYSQFHDNFGTQDQNQSRNQIHHRLGENQTNYFGNQQFQNPNQIQNQQFQTQSHHQFQNPNQFISNKNIGASATLITNRQKSIFDQRGEAIGKRGYQGDMPGGSSSGVTQEIAAQASSSLPQYNNEQLEQLFALLQPSSAISFSD